MIGPKFVRRRDTLHYIYFAYVNNLILCEQIKVPVIGQYGNSGCGYLKGGTLD